MTKSALQPWKVDSLRAWAGREVEAPPLYGWPETAAPPTALTGADEGDEND
jgi:hypothetical protein